jgi:cystathionine gamma-synthase
MERHCANAARVAEFLEGHEAVSRVFYPGLKDHPGHAVAAQQMAGFGGIVSVQLAGGPEAARHFVSKTRLFILAMSLGGVESLCEVPALMTHATMAGSDYSVDPALVRLSVGLEHVDDLVADLEQALTVAETVPTAS